MASDSGSVSIDPLFVGLTRPTMIFGVSFKFFFLNFFISVLSYINFPGLLVIGVAFALHLFAYIICFKEPLFLDLYLKKGQKCPRRVNAFYHGANSYDPY
ncbi:MAG: VirB3 family type IV secretion system protein [Rickettsiales bacterium]|nr:VirB3 family type IV secretion system protein [Rickettsiales bacterium]